MRQYAYGAQSSTHSIGIIEQSPGGPQSKQSVPRLQYENSDPGPPSSQSPSEGQLQVFEHSGEEGGGGEGEGGGGDGGGGGGDGD